MHRNAGESTMTTTQNPAHTANGASTSPGTAPAKRPPGWKDSKKYAWTFSLVPAAIPLIVWGVASWLKAINGPDLLIHVTWWAGPLPCLS